MIRFFDLFFSLLAVIVLSPLFLLIAVLLLATGEHEVFYLQNRVGKGKKLFKVIKFITMLKNAERMEGGEITRKNDPRVLPLGKFLRKTKINELPQLFNIIRGDMSVVGPRPLVPSQFGMYPEEIQERLATIKPGLSGIGSIVFRDEERLMSYSERGYDECFEKVVTPYKGELEAWYTENRTLRNYFKVIFLTVVVVLRSDARILGRAFRGLPEPGEELRRLMDLATAEKTE